jgi:integrase
MAHWEQHFADRRRNEITDLDAQTAFAQMRTLADSTRIHVRRALIQFYAALNGPSGYNPGRALKKPAKPAEPIRDLPWSDIEALFHALPPSRTKARLMLIAYIGLPQKQIAALRPSDLRLDRRELVVHPRRKGAGVSGRVQPLSDVGIAALREFARLQAFGTFQNRQLVETFRSGAKKAGITLPDGARPYDLRHSFLTELARSGADIRDIAHLGMHATLEQAARYVKGAAAERATNAITSVPRFCATTTRRNRPIRSSSVHRQGQPQPAPQRPTRGKKLRISSGKL